METNSGVLLVSFKALSWAELPNVTPKSNAIFAEAGPRDFLLTTRTFGTNFHLKITWKEKYKIKRQLHAVFVILVVNLHTQMSEQKFIVSQ